MFIILHEIGHIVTNTGSEKDADMFALNYTDKATFISVLKKLRKYKGVYVTDRYSHRNEYLLAS